MSNPLEQPFHAMIIRGDRESLEALAAFCRQHNGVDVEVPPFLVDSDTQTTLFPLLAQLDVETAGRTAERFEKEYAEAAARV